VSLEFYSVNTLMKHIKETINLIIDITPETLINEYQLIKIVHPNFD